jgi:DNA topoisomerase IB
MRAATDAERKALGIPPAYTEPLIAIDPNADLIAMATITTPSGKQKPFYKYSAAHIERQAKAKFKRVQKLAGKIEKIESKILRDCSSDDEETRALAVCARLVLLTGLRAGNPPQGVGESFGAASLLMSHVTLESDVVTLDFIGKKGVVQHVVVTDGIIANFIRDREAELRVFPHEANVLLRYMKSIGCEKVHDLRTLRAMLMAGVLIEELLKDGPPTTKKAAKLLRKTVGIEVAKILGNSPSQALKSYIDSRILPVAE